MTVKNKKKASQGLFSKAIKKGLAQPLKQAKAQLLKKAQSQPLKKAKAKFLAKVKTKPLKEAKGSAPAQPLKQAKAQLLKKAQSQPLKKAQAQPLKKAHTKPKSSTQPLKKAKAQPLKKAHTKPKSSTQPLKKAQSQPLKKAHTKPKSSTQPLKKAQSQPLKKAHTKPKSSTQPLKKAQSQPLKKAHTKPKSSTQPLKKAQSQPLKKAHTKPKSSTQPLKKAQSKPLKDTKIISSVRKTTIKEQAKITAVAKATGKTTKTTATNKKNTLKKPLIKQKQVPAGPSEKAKTAPIQKASLKMSMESKKILDLEKELAYLNEKKGSAQLIKDAKGRHYCHDEHCDQPAVTDIYCRYHYLALWPQIQNKKKLLNEDYLLKTVHQLIRSFGEKALNFILSDLKSEKSFESALREMNPSLLKEEKTLSTTEDTDL